MNHLKTIGNEYHLQHSLWYEYLYLYKYLFFAGAQEEGSLNCSMSLKHREASLSARLNRGSSFLTSARSEKNSRTALAKNPQVGLMGTCFLCFESYLNFPTFRATSASYSSFHLLTSSANSSFSSFVNREFLPLRSLKNLSHILNIVKFLTTCTFKIMLSK